MTRTAALRYRRVVAVGAAASTLLLMNASARAVGISRSLKIHGPFNLALNPTPTPAGATGSLPSSWKAEASLGGLDPQIAVSSTHVIVTTGTQIAFYDKQGTLLAPASGASWSNPMSMKTFFTPLIANLLAQQNLPSGIDKNIFSIDTYYDARVIFDEFHNRFWVGALAINWNTKEKKYADTASQRGARRTKFLLGVSKSEDPRDGFRLYWWDAVVNDGKTMDSATAAKIKSLDTEVKGLQQELRAAAPGEKPRLAAEIKKLNAQIAELKAPYGTFDPGDAGDFPSLGITDQLFLQTDNVSHRDIYAKKWEDYKETDSKYTLLNVVTARSLIDGAPTSGWHVYMIPTYDGSPYSHLHPAVHHDAHPDGYALLARSFSGSVAPLVNTRLISVYGVKIQNGKPDVKVVHVPISGFDSPPDAPQKKSADEPKPEKLHFGSNAGSAVISASYRDGNLYVAFTIGHKWSGIPIDISSIRLVRMGVRSFASDKVSVTVDGTFGRGSSADDVDLVYYGMPGVEVTKNGDIVMVFNRSHSELFLEVRTSIRLADAKDLQASALLKKGEGTCTKDYVQIDTSGIAADPNGKDIWVAQPYAYQSKPNKTSAQFRLIVGRIRP